MVAAGRSPGLSEACHNPSGINHLEIVGSHSPFWVFFVLLLDFHIYALGAPGLCITHLFTCMHVYVPLWVRARAHAHRPTYTSLWATCVCIVVLFVFLVAPTESPSRTANLKEKMNLPYPWNFPFPCGREVVGSGRWDSSPLLASVLCIRWWMSVGQFPLHVK